MKVLRPILFPLHCPHCVNVSIIKCPEGINSELIECPLCKKIVVVSDQVGFIWCNL